MGSFRARLTLSYTALAALLLIVVAAGLITFALALVIRPTVASLDETEASTRRIVATHPAESPYEVVGELMRRPIPSGLRVVAHPSHPKGPPPREARSLAGLIGASFGLHPRLIHIGEGDVFITAADMPRINGAIRASLFALALAVVLTLLASWLIGRWITQLALAPLIAVTGELRRFAQGDFTPRVVTSNDTGEVGALIEAYNGAAAQVAAAFSERERTEQHMRRFLGEAGHEMRTPLTVISGYLDVIERAGSDADAETLRLRAYPTMRVETQRLRTLVERVMSLARLENEEHRRPEPVDVVEVARDAIAEIAAVRPGDVRLSHGDDDCIVLAEPSEIHAAITNLVDNAVKYGAGAPVDVRVACDADQVSVHVRDGGPGISDADRARLFQHFFRGEHSAGVDGTGLGLAIVARAAKRSGGSAELEATAPGRGSTFLLAFPSYGSARRAGEALRVG